MRIQLCFHFLNAQLSASVLKSKRIRKSPGGVSNGFVTYEVNWNSMTRVGPITVPPRAFGAEALLPLLKHISMADGFK